MRTLLFLSLLLVWMAGPAQAAIAAGAAPSELEAASKQKLIASYGKLPIGFEANQGQTDPQVKFLSRGEGYHLYLTSNEAVLTLRKSVEKSDAGESALRMKLVDADPNPRISGAEELPGKSNYFVGRDPARWRSGVPTYAKVRYEAVYPGIDLIYYGNQRQLEYDFVVAPGADPKKIGLQFEGIDQLIIDDQGALALKVGGEAVQFLKPRLYQEVKGTRREISGRYVLRGKNKVGFQVADYDRSKPLIIDPVLSYSTFLGGSGIEGAGGIAVDNSGNAYVTGNTFSTDFPVTASGFQRNSQGTGDAFIAKLNATGTALIYATYLGGSGTDNGREIAIDSSGNAYVTGTTGSSDFPTTPGVFRSSGIGSFITKVNPSGSALIYSTYLPESTANSIAVDGSGNAYVTGYVVPNDNFFTTPGAFQSVYRGGSSDGFITKLNETGTAAVYSSFLGGSGDDQGYNIAVDASGNAYLTGYTNSANFPLARPLQPAIGGGYDAFVAKVNPAGNQLEYSTFLGGSDNDYGYGIAVDNTGTVYLTGETGSPNFPITSGAFQTVSGKNLHYWNPDAFVTKINPQGSAVVYSSYLGGSGDDSGAAIAVDNSGNVYVAGSTNSSDLPLVRSIKNSLDGGTCKFTPCQDVFLARVSAGGDALTLSTFLGGSGFESPSGMALDPLRNIYLAGSISSGGDFPTTPDAFQTDSHPMFITKIIDSPVLASIAATPQSGGGPLTVHFEATATSESGAAITSYLWNFGDGATGSGPKVDHTYTQVRGYTALLTVTDSNRDKGSAHANINVSDFGLNLFPAFETVTPGNSVTEHIGVPPGGGGTITVDMTCSTPQVPGLTCSMNPASVIPRTSEERTDPGSLSDLTVTTQPSTPVGVYPIVVTGRSGGAVHQVQFIAKVEPGDNFDRSDGTNLGPAWNEYLPDLELYQNQIRNVDSGSKAAIFNWPIGPDQDVSVDCKVTAADNGCGVMARWSNPNNYYYARIDVGHLNLVLFKAVNGVITELARGNLPPETLFNTYYRLRLVASGTTLTATVTIPLPSVCGPFGCTFDAKFGASATDDSLDSGDYAGIRSFASGPYTTWFENFEATRPGSSLPGGVLFTDEFNRTGGLGSNWRVTAGSYTTDGTFAVSGGAANWAAVAPNLGTNDYTVESVLTIPSGSLYSGIVARGNPSAFSSDLYAAQLSTQGTVNLYRKNAGNWTFLKSQAAGVVAGKPYTVALKVTGANPVTLEVSLDRSVLFSYQDSSASRILSGIPGIENYNSGVKYDRFTVYSIGNPDTTPPSTPTGLTATAQSGHQVSLSWSASTDNIQVDGYRIYRNGTQIIPTIFTGSPTSAIDNEVVPNTTYTYSVSAVDLSGNESSRSAPATITIPSAPLVSIRVEPSNPSIQTGATQPFRATGFYQDNTTQDITSSVTWNSSNTAVATISNQAGSQGRATGVAAGSATITATDPASNVSGSTGLIVTAADQVPTARISATPTSGTAPLTVHFDGSASSDPDGAIASYSWSFGDGSNGTGATTDHTYTAAGTYTATLTVTDNQGAKGSAQSTITATASGGGPLFNDDFNRTTGLGSNWAGYGGSFTTDGAFAVSQSPANWAAVTANLGTNDYTVQARLIVPAGSLYSGIVARGNLATGFTQDVYAAQIAGNGTVNLYRRNGYAWTLLKSVKPGTVAGQAYTLGLKVSGSIPVNLEVFLDGASLMTFSDSSAARLLSGAPGIENYNSGVKYDQFTVTSGAASPPPPSNGSPTAQLSVSPISGAAPLAVHFDGSSSFDPDGAIASYHWDFGDGTAAEGATADHIYAAPPPAGLSLIERVSVGLNGGEANGNSTHPFLSRDGRYVAFESDASNLVPGDTNGVTDLFVYDRVAKKTVRVSVDSDGIQGNGRSFGAKMSGDGRFVIFESDATNLVPGDTNGVTDLFVHDLQTGTTERVTVDSNGVQGNGISGYGYLNADGRYAVFFSAATNLVPDDTNNANDIFIHDRLTGATARVSVDSNGVQASEGSYSFCPSISDDGRYVSFISDAVNLVPGDTNNADDIFVRDLQTGVTTRVSVDSSGAQADGESEDAKITGDGRYVLFESKATNLVAADTNGQADLFLYDRLTGRTTRVSVDSNGAQANGPSGDARISEDGRFAAFDSDASNLVSGDTNVKGDIFVHDQKTGRTFRMSLNAGGFQGNGGSQNARISNDGRMVAFDSAATNLVPGDTNGVTDIFVVSGPGTYAVTLTVADNGGASGTTTDLIRVDAQGGLSFSDNFDRADSTSMGSNWNEYLPDFEIFNNQLRNANGRNLPIAAVANTAIGPDQDISVDCLITAPQNSCAIMARWSDANNFYRVRLGIEQGNLALFKTVNDTTTLLGSASRPVQFNTFYRMRLVVKGSQLSIYFNNETSPALTLTDTSLTSGNYAGLRSFAIGAGTTYYDNFAVSLP